MERDFMGLNPNSEIKFKEEVVEGGSKDSGHERSLGIPNFLSLKSEQDEKSSLMKPKLLGPPGYAVKSGEHVLEVSCKRQPVDIQNFGIATMKQQFLGTTEQLTNFKAPDVTDQLTIFYAGTVHVFDGISPEKAQALALLAGNYCVPPNVVQSKLHVQAPKFKPPCGNQGTGNLLMNMPPCSGLPSPLSVSSHPIDQSGGASVKVEPPRMASSIGSVALTAMISSAVPQFRKASLARFLKKRNERVLSAAPYNLVKKENERANTPESNASAVSSSFIPTSKEAIDDI